jgi:TP901 family phage tail tape measure protein
MADFTRSVELIFGGKDNVSPTLKTISTNLDKFESSVGNVAGPVSDVGDSILQLNAAIGALGAVMVGVALNEASKFESAFAEISTLFDTAPENLQQFSTDIRDFASSSTQSIDDINRSVYSAISAGADYTESLELLQSAEQLAVAGNADLDSSLVVLLSSLNAFGLETSSAADFADTLFRTVQLGQTTLPELSASLSLVTGIAANAGVSFSELNATIAALTATGIPTSQAITGIKAALSNIVKPSEQAIALSKELNLDFNANALASKGFAGVLGEVATATGGSTEELARLFKSTEALNIVLSLTGKGADKFAESLAAMEDRTGAVEAAYEKMVGTLKLANQNLINNIRLTFIDSGLKIIDQFTDDVSSLTDVFKALRFSVNDGAFDPIFDALNDFGLNIEETLNNIAQNLPDALAGVDFTGIVDAFQDLGGNIGTLFDNVDLNTAEGLRDVIQKLIDAGEGLVRITGGMVESYKPLFDALTRGVTEFNNLDDATKNNIGNFLGIGQQVDRLLPVFSTMHGAVNGLAAAITSLSVVLGTRGLIGAFGAAAGSVGVLVSALNPLVIAAGGVGAGIGTLINKVVELSGTSIGSFFYDLINEPDKATESIRLLGNELGRFDETLQEYSDAAYDAAIPIGQLNESALSLAEGFEKNGYAFDSATGAVTKLGDSTAVADEKTSRLINTVKSVVDGVVTYTQATGGISKGNKDIADTADEAKKKSEELVVKLEQIASNERIKNIEATVNLNIAALEADAKVAVAIIEGLSDSIASTAELIGGLFGILQDADPYQEGAILRQIKLENENRAKQLELEKALIEAQVRNLDAKTEKLRDGDGLITITADGLETELEQFMMAVLRRVQIKASEDQSLYLLGLPVA